MTRFKQSCVADQSWTLVCRSAQICLWAFKKAQVQVHRDICFLIFSPSSQWSDMILSSRSVHREKKSFYRKEGVLRAFAFFFSPFSRGYCTTLDLTMNLSSHHIIVNWKERSSSDMPVNLILIFSLRSLWWADLDLNYLNFIQLWAYLC